MEGKERTQFGTFETLTDREDEILNRLAFLRRRIEVFELEFEETQQDIQMWKNMRMDKKDKLKIWLVILGVLLGYCLIVFLCIHTVGEISSYLIMYVVSVVNTFLLLIRNFIVIPLAVITTLILLILGLRYYLCYTDDELAVTVARNFGIKNTSVLIQEARPQAARLYKELEEMKEEKAALEAELAEIQKKVAEN